MYEFVFIQAISQVLQMVSVRSSYFVKSGVLSAIFHIIFFQVRTDQPIEKTLLKVYDKTEMNQWMDE